MYVPDIQWVGADPSNFKTGNQARSETIIANGLVLVMHEMEGTLASTDGWFNRKRVKPSSAHYGVGKTGKIHQYVKDVDIAYSNGNVLHPNLAAVPWLAQYENNDHANANDICLSIEWEGEHVWKDGIVGGTVAQWWQPTPVQLDAGINLARYLAAKYAIRLDRSHITRHSDFDTINKRWCPGEGFPLATVIKELQAGTRETMFVDAAASAAKPVSVKGPPKISPNQFQDVLQAKNSPVWPLAAAIYATCVQSYVDPAVWLAFFGRESSFGTDPNNLFVQTNNSGNLVGDQSLGSIAKSTYLFAGHKFRVYASVLDGVQDWCNLWNSPIYRNKSLADQLAIYDNEPNGSSRPLEYAAYVETAVRAWEAASGSFMYLGAS